jgi:hypothetical protein
MTTAVLAAMSVVGCSHAGSNTLQACATFNHAYSAWQRTPHTHAAGRRLVAALDDAANYAGRTNLTGALQAVAANVRVLPSGVGAPPRLLAAVDLVRKTCPAK